MPCIVIWRCVDHRCSASVFQREHGIYHSTLTTNQSLVPGNVCSGLVQCVQLLVWMGTRPNGCSRRTSALNVRGLQFDNSLRGKQIYPFDLEGLPHTST